MIFCSMEPGLLSLHGIAPHEYAVASEVLEALFLHRRMVGQMGAKLPATEKFIAAVLDDLNRIPILDPPIGRTFGNLIREMLANIVRPPPASVQAGETQFAPDIASTWISTELKDLWVDSLVTAIADLPTLNNGLAEDAILAIATWQPHSPPCEVSMSNVLVSEYLNLAGSVWRLPLLRFEHDWKFARARTLPWGERLEDMVDEYARRNLGILPENIGRRPRMRFDTSCHRAICDESDPTIRTLLIEVMARRAYNLLQPQHGDEVIVGNKDVRRVRVKKMAPPVRLHYRIESTAIVYVLYSNGDHDKGL